jgi:CRP-like cAMP-binding protein
LNAHYPQFTDRLKDLPLFHGLSEPDLARILQVARTKTVQDGEFLFFQGDPADRIFVLLTGRIKLTKSAPGEQPILLRMIQPVAVIGTIAAAPAQGYPVSAQAADECRLLYWTRTEITAIMAQIPQLALNAMGILAEHAEEFQARYQQMVTERVERRLARTLLRLAAQAGKKTEEGILIDLPLTRQNLAEMTGTTLFTVSRMLSQWETQGLVISGRERVVLRQPHGLVTIAEDLNSEEPP